jgi:hypothetical protein
MIAGEDALSGGFVIRAKYFGGFHDRARSYQREYVRWWALLSCAILVFRTNAVLPGASCIVGA